MTRFRAWWDSVRQTYWAVPSLMAAGAAALATGAIRVDESVGEEVVDTLSWVYTGSPDGARAVLSTIASSMITVAGVTFSITTVALTLASQQFGPRLLRNFMRDLGNQITLGTFVSTFVYCLLVLRTVRGSDHVEFVPSIAVSVGVLLALISLGILIYFIHHVATSIQAAHIIAGVGEDLRCAIDRLFPEKLGAGAAAVSAQEEPPDEAAGLVVASIDGYVQAIDGARLMDVASAHDRLVRVERGPGRFVRRGSVLARCWPPPGQDDGVLSGLASAFVIGAERTATQDVAFFVDQLVDVAVRALSPGINDPATAQVVIERLSAALCQLAGREIPSAYRADEQGRLRVIARPVDFTELADAAFNAIRQYGRTSCAVSLRLLEVIADIASCVRREEDRLTLLRHAAMVQRAADAAAFEELDRRDIEARYRGAVAALERPACRA